MCRPSIAWPFAGRPPGESDELATSLQKMWLPVQRTRTSLGEDLMRGRTRGPLRTVDDRWMEHIGHGRGAADQDTCLAQHDPVTGIAARLCDVRGNEQVNSPRRCRLMRRFYGRHRRDGAAPRPREIRQHREVESFSHEVKSASGRRTRLRARPRTYFESPRDADGLPARAAAAAAVRGNQAHGL